MQFYDYTTTISDLIRLKQVPRGISRDEALCHLIDNGHRLRENKADAQAAIIQYYAEDKWEYNRRPYYNLWPAAADVFLNVPLTKVLTDQLKPRLPVLAVRFPRESNPLDGVNWSVSSFLAWYGVPCDTQEQMERIKSYTRAKETLAYVRSRECLCCDEPGGNPSLYLAVRMRKGDDKEASATMHRRVVLVPGETVESVLYREVPKSQTSELSNAVERCVTLCCMLSMLDNDSELLERIVLNKDREKYQASGDDKYVQKAINRGMNGWDIGRELESVPHYRRRHWAIRWTGHGEPKIPRLCPIKATWVNREKISDVPTGYLDDDEK